MAPEDRPQDEDEHAECRREIEFLAGLVDRAMEFVQHKRGCPMLEVGVSIECSVCGRRKKPRGRSAPLEMANSLCDHECKGYERGETTGDLWPGETRAEFGYGATCDPEACGLDKLIADAKRGPGDGK